MNIKMEVSPAELIDRITILSIKKEKIEYPEYLMQINEQLDKLKKLFSTNIHLTSELQDLINNLRVINEELWDLESEIRLLKNNENSKFIETASRIFYLNNSRADLKNKINKLLKYNFLENKYYK